MVVTNWCGFGDTDASPRGLHSTPYPRRRVAAAPAFHLVHLLADAKADDRFHEAEVVETQSAQPAPKPNRHLNMPTRHHVMAPAAKSRRLTSLVDGGQRENQVG